MLLLSGFGLALLGIAGVFGTPGLLRIAEQVWPRRFSRQDADSFASAAFLVRFVSLLTAVAGVAMIALHLVGE